MSQVQPSRVLITVKTYPQPSKSHIELVCTAGVFEDGSFVRLYPMDFRYMPRSQQFKKYQWIEVVLEKNPKDPRKESYKPRLETVKVIGERLPTTDKWKQRKKYVLAQGAKSLEELMELQERDKTSLGIVRPLKIDDLIVEKTETHWKPQWEVELKQKILVGPSRKLLEKIPYVFRYKFLCADDRCNGHTMQIEDWELGALYLDMRDKFGSEKTAVEKVKQKFFDQMCAPKIDTHFFVGTTLAHGTWVVLGVFWPLK